MLVLTAIGRLIALLGKFSRVPLVAWVSDLINLEVSNAMKSLLL